MKFLFSIVVLTLFYQIKSETSTPSVAITTPTNAKRTVLGSKLVLNCSVTTDDNNPVATYSWFKDNNLINTETESTLTKNPLSKADTGNYICGVTANTTKKSDVLPITVKYLEVSIKANDLKPKEGSNLTLNCSASTNIIITDWKLTKGGDIFNPTTTTSVSAIFNIANINATNSGSYNCQAFNTTVGLKTSNTTLTITVQEVVTTPMISFNQAAVSGDKVTLTCTATSSTNDTITYQFFKDNAKIRTPSTNPQLIFANVTTNNGGLYKCQASFGSVVKMSTSSRLDVNIKVTVENQKIVSGNTVVFTCITPAGETIDTYQWTIGSTPVGGNNKMLTVEATSDKNGNSYKCKATANTTISAEGSGTLTVYFLENPTLTTNPTSVSSNVEIVERSKLTFTCSIKSNPTAVSYEWYKDDKIIKSATSDSFIIKSVNRTDQGNRYACKVSNSKISTKKTSSTIALKVLYMDKPGIAFVQGNSTPLYQTNVQLICNQSSNIVAGLDYEWTKDSKFVPSGQTLTLPAVQKVNTGDYKCITKSLVYTELTEMSDVQRIDVHYPPTALRFTPDKDYDKELGRALEVICYTDDYGFPAIKLSWYNGDKTAPSVGVGGNAMQLNIKPVTRESTGNYTCKGSNTAGSVSKTLEYKTLEKPDVPRSIEKRSSTTNSIEITWTKPLFDGNKPVTGYIIKYESAETNITKNTTSTKYNVTGLNAGITYVFKVAAVNMFGTGSFETFNTGTAQSVPSQPKSVTMNSGINTGTIDLTWATPSPTNGNITDYRICYHQLSEDSTPNVGPNKCEDVGLVLKHTLTGLGKYNGYHIGIRAENNAGFGLWFNMTNITTKEEKPTKVQNLGYSTSGTHSITVKWTKSKNIFGILKNYTVTYRLKTASPPPIIPTCTDLTKNLKCIILNLKPYRTYVITITVTNSLYSTATDFEQQTKPIAPPPPTKPLPAPAGATKTTFKITLIKFDEQNGQIKHYDVIVKSLGKDSATLPSTLTTSYSNQDIANRKDDLYIAARITDSAKFNQTVTIGSGNNYRKRRSLGVANNKALAEGTYYTIFIRAYVGDDVYVTTTWYTAVKTEAASGSDAGLIAGIVILIVAIICIIAAVAYYFIKRKHNLNPVKEVELEQKKRQKSFRSLSPPGQDPRVPVPVKNFEEHVMRLKANSNFGFSQEYIMINRELTYPYSQSRLQENNIKNRYHNVPAYDETRVILQEIDDDAHSDYINANYVEGFSSVQEYIATQGPLPETVFDFWRMVWESSSTTVVMLTKVEEKGRVKCAQYWPDSGSLSLKDIIITATEIHEFPDHIVRTFHLTRTGQAVEKIVKQFHFIAWPDFGVPVDPSALLSFMRKVNIWKGVSHGPMVIHCSAGVGRTGTYITIATQIKNIKQNKEINIYGNVTAMREQRCLMVQTEDQYIFIHNALLDYLESGDTEIEANELREYIKRHSQVDVGSGLTGLMDEFIRLAKADKKENFTEANRSVNATKNRYLNVYPYNDSRVKLSQRSGIEGSDYINANFVDSYASKDYFIAAQAPLEATIGDFWRMMWEQNCGTIVMLSKEIEGGQVKVHPYWPQKSSFKIECFIIELLSVTTYGDHLVRELKLTNTEASTSRDVRQFQYTTWPDSGSPESGVGIIDLIGQVQKWNGLSANKKITVHCSAGVGRTGVFIALTNLIERVKLEAVADVYQTVKKMRQQRTAMVQTREQYEFCYQALQEYLDSFDLYDNFR